MTTIQLGQYFTISEELQTKVLTFILNKPKTILEPSFGKGHLVIKIIETLRNVKIVGYEIDKDVLPIVKSKNLNITYSDFLEEKIGDKYETIIGNPPYVKTSSGNLYIKFIEKCVELLGDMGELIFIVPSDFLKVTMSKNVISDMVSIGSFTDIYFPNKENLFTGANIDVMVFRYQKGLFTNKAKINDKLMYSIFSDGIMTFHETLSTTSFMVKELFNVYVGIVSGKESVFKNDNGNVKVLNDRGVEDTYVLLTSFPSPIEYINKYMLEHKSELISRKIRKFNEKNWWEWGALRNIKTIKENIGRPCIYMYNITRKSSIAFKGRVQLFGGKLLCMIPKSTSIDLDNVVEFLNSDVFKKNYIYSDRFKIGHKQLCNARIL
jgi:adenine-specific DNA-methyltransferase